MILGSPALERRLRKEAKREMRSDRALWRDYRRHRTVWLRRKLRANGRVALLFVYFIFLEQMVVRGGGLALLGVAIYASATTLFRAFTFRANVLQGYDRTVLLHLPISDEEFFTHEWNGFVFSWSRAFVLFFIAYEATLFGSGLAGKQLAVAALAAALQSLCGLSVASWLIAYVRKAKVGLASTALYILILVSLWVPAASIRYLWSAVLITPGGWVSHGFAGLTGSAPSRETFWLVPAFAVAILLPFAYGALRRRMLVELTSQTSGESVGLDELLAEREPDVEELPGQVKPLDPDAAIWQGHFLQGADWARSGWLEKVAVRWFTSREKTIAEFMLGDQLGAWSKRWGTAALISGLGIILTFALQPLPSWVLFLPIVAGGMCGAPLFGGFWLGFNGAPASGQLMPAYASFPISYAEISRVMFKSNAIRILAWTPLALAYATALAVRMGHSAAYGVTIGIEIVVIVVAVQPAMVVGHFSVGSNDTKQINWPTLSYFGLALILFVIVIAASIALFEVEALEIKVLAALALGVVNVVAWVGYRLLFNSGAMDLLSQPQYRS